MYHVRSMIPFSEEIKRGEGLRDHPVTLSTTSETVHYNVFKYLRVQNDIESVLREEKDITSSSRAWRKHRHRRNFAGPQVHCWILWN